MSQRPLMNFYRTLLSIARVELRYCCTPRECKVVRSEIRRLERKLLETAKPAMPRKKGAM